MNRSGAGLGLALLALWLLLWGSFSVADVLSGLAVVALVGFVLPGGRLGVGVPTVRPLPAARFAGRVLVDLVRANLVVSGEILRPDPTVATGIVAVPLPFCSDGVFTLVADVVALAPGTLPIEVTDRPRVLYVHVLQLRDADAVRRDTQRLAVLAVRAFGTAEEVAAAEAALRGHTTDAPTDTGGRQR